jgi:WD40 repeat protein
VRQVLFHPDGQRLFTSAAADKQNLKLWDLARGTAVALDGHTGWVNHLELAPGGRLLVSAGWDGSVRLWDTHTLACVRTFQGHGLSHTWQVAVSPDGSTLYTAGENQILAWDLASGAFQRTLFEGSISSLVAHPDGRQLVAAGGQGLVRLLDLEGGPERQLSGLVNDVRCLGLLPSGEEVVAAEHSGSEVRLWALAGATPPAGPAQDRFSTELRVDPTGRWALTDLDGGGSSWWDEDTDACLHCSGAAVAVWDLATAQPIHRLEGSEHPVAFLPDGQHLLTAGQRGAVLRWDLATGAKVGEHVGRLERSDARSTTLGRIHPDGVRMLRRVPAGENVGGFDRWKGATLPSGPWEIEVWSLRTGKTLHRLIGHPGRVDSMQVFAGGERLLSVGQGGERRVWDLSTGRLERELPPLAARSNSTRLFPDGRRVLHAVGKSLVISDLETGDLLETIKLRAPLLSLQLLPGGTQAVGVSAKALKWFDLEKGKEVRSVEPPTRKPFRVRVHPSGRWVMTLGGYWDWDVFETATGRHVMTRPEQSNHVTAEVLWPQVEHWATIGFVDTDLEVWSLATGQRLARWRPERSNGAVALAPDGRIVLAEPRRLVVLALEGAPASTVLPGPGWQ